METVRLFRGSRLAVDTAAGLECLLSERRPLRLRGARGRFVRCLDGCTWITSPRMFADVILHDGEEWRIDTDELVLVEAIGRATVAICAGAQSTSPST